MELLRAFLAPVHGACGALLLTWTTVAIGQTSPPSPASAETWELPGEIRAELAQTQDGVYNFDQPGFYGVLAFVKRGPHAPGFMQAPIQVKDWRDLLERPTEFRGRPVTIEGVVGRVKDPYTLYTHRDLGPIWQLELHGPDQPIQCTLILTEPAGDIALGSTLTVTGYFVMIRKYYGASNSVHQAALLVAAGPTGVSRNAPGAGTAVRPDSQSLLWGLLAALAVGLLIWLLLRRAAAGGRTDLHLLRARHGRPPDDGAQRGPEEEE